MTDLSRRHLLTLLAALPVSGAALAQGAETVTILTVPAMQEPLRAILGRGLHLIAAPSHALPIKVESELTADILITEDPAQMEEFINTGVVVPDSRTALGRDRLVMVQRSDLARVAVIRPGLEFRYVVEDGRFGLLTEAAGLSGQRIMGAADKLNLVKQLGERVDGFDDPLQIVQALQRGDVAAAFLPHSLCATYGDLEVVGTVPEALGPALTYVAGILEGHNRPAVQRAFARLSDSESTVTWAQFGLQKPL